MSTTTINDRPTTVDDTGDQPIPTAARSLPRPLVAAAEVTGPTCPVSPETVDAPAARLSATATGALLAVYVLTGAWPVLALVLVDYVVRVFTRRRAPLGLLARLVLDRLGVPTRPMARAPKAFAWGVGFTLAATSAALVPVAPTASLVVAAVLAGFSLLDGVGGVCVGCLTHQHLVAPLRRRVGRA